MRLGREFDIIKGIVNTEKTSRALAESKYTFNVDTNANKDEIKSAIEKVFFVVANEPLIMQTYNKFIGIGLFPSIIKAGFSRFVVLFNV